MTAPVSQAELLSLERLLPLNDNDLPATEPKVEGAIDKLLAAATYHLSHSPEFGLDWWSVAYQLLPLDGKAELLPECDFGPEDAWTGKWSDWRGNTELFLELYSALRLLVQKNQTIRAVSSGAKGGASSRSSEVAEEVRDWYAKEGRYKRPNKSASLDYLIGNWAAFASEHGLNKDTPPDKKSLYRYLKQLQHQPDQKVSHQGPLMRH